MIRRLRLIWPDERAFDGRDGAPIRLLAASDEVDPGVGDARNREGIGALDAIIGCGDLEPDYLAFLADAFGAPLGFVRGNHDRGGHWQETATHAPRPLRSGQLAELGGLTVAALGWPAVDTDRALRDEGRAWRDVLLVTQRLVTRRLLARGGPVVVVSHAPPRGVGDDGADPYHLGYAAYRWLLERARPPLWLHGHVPPASVRDWRATSGPTTVVNVTGVVVVELVPPGSVRRPGDRGPLGGREREAA
jgi:hypothetical protein